jgi:hypothetical protein
VRKEQEGQKVLSSEWWRRDEKEGDRWGPRGITVVVGRKS